MSRAGHRIPLLAALHFCHGFFRCHQQQRRPPPDASLSLRAALMRRSLIYPEVE